MVDSVDTTQVAIEEGRWLLLIHQIPPKPDYLRVKVRRRLQQIGAVPLKNSVYVLPRSDDAMEDFQWLRRVVVDDGGEATICAASFINGPNNQEVESMFRAQSDVEYGEIIDAARIAETHPTDADIRRLNRRLAQAQACDFFKAKRAEAAARAIDNVENNHAQRQRVEHAGTGVDSAHPRGDTWVTRTGVFVDRIASAWLIKRFIDDAAQFKFVPAKGYRPKPGELRFDMFEGEFTHEGDKCTFEVLITRFAIADPALHAIAEIIHDIDCKDDKYRRDETAGVESVIRGIAIAYTDDTARVEAGTTLFNGLYAAFE